VRTGGRGPRADSRKRRGPGSGQASAEATEAAEAPVPGRLLAICSSTSWGGTEKWCLRACELLAERGWTVRLAVRNLELFESRRTAPAARKPDQDASRPPASTRDANSRPGPDLARSGHPDRGRLEILPLPLRNDADLGSVLRLATLARGSDVVLATRVRDYWLGGLAARMAARPLLLRLGVIRPMRAGHWRDRVRYARLPSALIVNTGVIRDVLLRTPWFARTPIHVVYNGVDAPGPVAAEERIRIRQRLAVAPEELLIVGAGRLAAEKRWDWLIDSARRLENASSDAPQSREPQPPESQASQPPASRDPLAVRILGEGAERPHLEARIAEHGLQGIVRLEGLRADTDDWLAAADLFVLSSRNEGISNAILEAMGRGVPVVATRAGGIDEVARDGEHAFLAEVDDFEGFAHRILQACADPGLRREIGARGLALVRERLTWEAMAERLEEVLHGMM